MLKFVATFLLVSDIFIPAALGQKNLDFLLFHTGNIHGQFEQSYKSGGVGGCARMAHVIKTSRKANDEGRGPPVLYFDTGNIFVGSAWFSLHKYKICAAFMNKLGPNAMGVEFPVVVSNLRFNLKETLQRAIEVSYVLKLNGRKIGIVGYLTTEKSSFGIGVAGMEILDEVDAIRKTSRRLVKEKGVNIIIALGHANFYTHVRVAKLVEEVDIVVAGTPSDKPGEYITVVKRDSGRGVVPIVHIADGTKYVGKLLVSFDKDGMLTRFGGKSILLNRKVPQDPETLRLLESFKPDVDKANTSAVGESRVLLDGESCRYQECNFGNLVADSLVLYNANRYAGVHWHWTDSAVALINAGAICSSIDAKIRGHVVYKANLLESFPYNNSLYSVVLMGKDLVRSLEHAIRRSRLIEKGEFLVSSGLKVVYDLSGELGNRVKSVKVKCSACSIPRFLKLDMEARYKVITIDYLVLGGDAHKAIHNAENQIQLEGTIIEAIMEYFESNKVVMPELDGRVTINSPRSSGVKLQLLATFFTFIVVIFVIKSNYN